MERIRKRVDVEDVGIDLSKLDEEFLYRVAEIAEEEIRKALDEVLGPRMIKYILLVDVNVDDKLNVFVDLLVDSRIPPYIRLESVLDRAIKRGLDKAAAYVRAYAREAKAASSEREESRGADSQQR